MATLNVPAQFATIAAAISQAAPNDTILVDASYGGNETATVTVENISVNAPASVQGIDLILGSGISSVTLAGSANIDVTGNGLANSLVGNAGSNTLNGLSGQDHYYGLAGNDTLVGGGGADFDIADYSRDAANGGTSGIVANQSAMRVQGGIDPDTVVDGFGNTDSIVGIRNIVATNSADKIYAGNNANVLTGLDGNDLIEAGGGSDTIYGGSGVTDPNETGADELSGGFGNDIVYGNGGGDRLLGNQNDDLLFGGAGNDFLHGGMNNDILVGGIGTDTLNGGLGVNQLTGGDGADRFQHTATGQDTITDFSFSSGDRIDLGGQSYTATESSGSTTLAFTDGGSIVLQGVTGFGDGFIA